MRINLLYLIIPLALLGAWYIVRDLKGQGEVNFFGTAESDPRSINLDVDLVVKKLFVASGQFVKSGDTLLIAYRKELDRDSLSYSESTLLDQIQLSNRQSELLKDKQLLEAQSNYEIGKLLSEINSIRLRDSLDQKYRSVIFNEPKYDKSLEQTKINELNSQISKLQSVFHGKANLIEEEIKSLKDLSRNKSNLRTVSYQFNKNLGKNLIVTAPFDGFIDQISVQENSAIQAFRDLMRINPKTPSKIIGFIHEISPISFQIGDTVKLFSAVRPELSTEGIITSVSPRLVELPLRLRKFIEVRAWGREIFIQMDQNPGFYIGEKISISLNAHL